MKHNPLTPGIYRKLMLWMEGRILTQCDELLTPVLHNSPSKFTCASLEDPSQFMPVRELQFRKGIRYHHMTRSMLPCVESVDKPGVLIYYDPSWEAYYKIDELLKEED